MSQELVTNSVYHVTLHPTLIYGNEIRNLTFKARLTADLVTMYGVIPHEEHRKVYSSLPEGVIDDPDSYDWLIFKALNGDTVIIGEPWIKTLEGGTQTTQYIVKVTGDTTTPNKIRAALSSIGIHHYSIETFK